MELTKLTVAQLMYAYEQKELSALEVTEAYVRAIEEKDDEIGAYITKTTEQALETARGIDKNRMERRPLNILAGIPIGIKDNICTNGILTTCASKMLSNFVPPYDATVMERLGDTVMLGKLNMDEFAMGATTETSHYHKTKNPVDTSRVPGGSSGGSAAAVAAGEAAFTLGSDTGGSIRQPAAFCGVVGIKPTYGSVSRNGLIAFASSLDQIGALTKDVQDAAIVLNAIAGYDKRDSTSVARSYQDFGRYIGEDIRGMRIALPKNFFGDGLQPEIKENILAAVTKLEKMGAIVEEVDMGALDHALAAYYVISSAEASSNLARFDGIKYGYRAEIFETLDDLYKNTRSEGFGDEVKRRIMLGTYALSSGYYDAYYKKALQVRTLVVREYERIFLEYDLVVSPVTPTTAYKLGEKAADPLEMYMGDIYTVPVNIAGLPGLSMPCGADAKGLPIGIQLISKAFGEATIFKAAFALEQALGEV